MKRISLLALGGLSFILAFTLGGAYEAKAYPAGGLWGRGEYNGYFTNVDDTAGTYVWPTSGGTAGCAASGGYAIPLSVNNIDAFVNFVRCKLGGNTQERTGAAFIIQTMRNPMSAPNRTIPPTAAQVDDWEAMVRYANYQGRIRWGISFPSGTFAYNSFYQATGTGQNPIDDAFYDHTADTGPIISFVNSSGTVLYSIRHECANPIGNQNFAPLPNNPDFNMSGTSSVDVSTVPPGGVLHFTHTLTSSGATSPLTIDWTTQNTQNSNSTVATGNASTFTAGQTKSVGPQTFTVSSTAVAGSKVCRRVVWDPDTSAGGSGASTPACATVSIVDYLLDPSVTADKTTVQDGDTVTFTYAVANSGSTASAPAQCTVGGGGSPALTCSTSQVFAANSPPLTVGTETVTIGTQSPGTKICRWLNIDPSEPTGTSRVSEPTCVVVAKTPYVQFLGNDVWAGGGYASAVPGCNTSAKITTVGRALSGTSPTQYAGSVVEYNAFALSQVSSFGSAGRVLVNFGSLGSTPRSMTFGNNEATLSSLGYYGAAQHCLVDYKSLFTGAAALAAGTYDIGSLGSGTWYVASGNLHLSGTAPAGAKQVFVAEDNIFVDGDLQYPASYASGLASIPSLVVVSGGNILVSGSVGQMDGLFVAQGDGVTTGMFRDCWPKTSPQAVGDACDAKQLVVNGAVLAGSLELWRSYGGAGATVQLRQTPAEIFQFAPEIYLRNALVNNKNQSVEVTNLTELPPRF